MIRFGTLVLLIGIVSVAYAQTGVITTVAGATPVDGAPVRGFSGDGGPAAGAALALANIQNACDPGTFEQGVHIALDSGGNLYIADGNNHRIRRVSTDGIITTVAGRGERPQINERCEPTSPVNDGGPATAGRLYNPAGVAIHPSGDLIIADQQNNRLRRVAAGSISTVAGSGMHNIYAPNIPATTSPMDWPSAVAVDANGTVYFAEVHSHRVGRIASDGRFVTVAGTAFSGFAGDGGQGTAARLRNPTGIALDAAGNVYIADPGNHRIRKVGTDGIITTVAGTGQPGDGADGTPATQAALNTPMDVKVDAAGQVYIADTLNHKVKRVGTDGIITTVAGDGIPGRGPDNVSARSSSLRNPAGLAIAGNGDVYIADWQNYLVRKVSFSARPAITRGGIVNAASFAAGALAPGTIVTIAGSQLAASTRAASAVPLATRMEEASVEVNGRAIPLYFVSPSQINAQLPYDLAPGTATLRVSNTTGASAEEAFQVAASSPGVFQLDSGGRAAALNQDNSINAPENPERTGNVVTVFLTGLGAVAPPVPEGAAAPSDSISRAIATVTATVAGVSADVLFAGLTPGSVGLAQVNIAIPATTAPGPSVPVAVRAGDQVSNSVTISVR